MAIKYTTKEEGFINSIVKDGTTQAEAYRRNYKTDRMNSQAVAESASRLAASPKVSARIQELTAAKQAVAKTEFDVTVKMLLKTFVEIAFTDPNELITVRQGCCRHCHGEGHEYQWKEREYIAALEAWEKVPASKQGPMPAPLGGYGYRHTRDPHPECPECGGEGLTRLVPKDSTKLSPGALHLYRGAQHTKDGIKILFADKDASLDKIARILGAYDDRLRVDLKGAVATMQLTTSDPVEAAREYEKMLAGSSG